MSTEHMSHNWWLVLNFVSDKYSVWKNILYKEITISSSAKNKTMEWLQQSQYY